MKFLPGEEFLPGWESLWRTNGGGYAEVLNFQQGGGYILLYMPLCYLRSGMRCIYTWASQTVYRPTIWQVKKCAHRRCGEAHHPDSLTRLSSTRDDAMGIIKRHFGHDLQSIYSTIFCQFCKKVVPRLSEHGDVSQTHVSEQSSCTGAPKLLSFFSHSPKFTTRMLDQKGKCLSYWRNYKLPILQMAIERNYFATLHHQAGAHFEVKFRDI